jgi:hypothetical protein
MSEIKQELTRRVEQVTQRPFLESRIRPCLGAGPGLNGDWKTRIVQLDSTGAATVEIKNGPYAVFAKLYPNDQGPAIYEKLKTMRATGFGPKDRYQAVEPLDFIPEYAMILTRGAQGPAVSTHIGVDDSALLNGVRESASWLARLHSSPLQIGSPHTLLVSGELLSLARRLSKVMTQRPDHLDLALDMIRTLEGMAEETHEGTLVQSHGQYRPIHVFIGDSAVTVIDLDRSRPSDPARDVAEFVHRLRMTTFGQSGSADRAEAPTRAFLETYAAEAKPSFLANLPFHWARYIFHSLNNKLKGTNKGDPETEATVAFYRSEFDKVVQGQFRV